MPSVPALGRAGSPAGLFPNHGGIMKMKRKNALMASASVISLVAGLAFAPAPAVADSYMAGDFHNHTTCNDGATSVQTMVTTSLSTFGLEWLGDSGHGGSFTRDC